MTPERYKVAQAKFKLLSPHPAVLYRIGEFSSPQEAHNWHFYKKGFEDGVELILESSSNLKALEKSLAVKDIRMAILEKDNKSLNMRLEHRKKLHSEAVDELKIVLDRLSLLIGLRDPALLKQMEEIRKRLEVSERG